MEKTFDLETLRIRFNDAELQPFDLHQRVQRALRDLILDGTFAPGLKLPATRSLAKSLQLSRDTVENAYLQLHRDQYIVRRQGSGSYVSKTLGPELLGEMCRGTKIQESKRNILALESGLSRRGRITLDSGGVTDQQTVKAFATGLPETRTFPIKVWERLQRQTLKNYRNQILLHGNPQGTESLRKAISIYLNLERGAKVAPDQVLILSSTRQALFLCAQLLIDAGKPIFMENPGYFGAQKAFGSAETEIIPIDVDGQGIRIDFLNANRSNANCVYVTPSHQYPTGITMSLERRLELLHWAAENEKWIIEDDYDSEFHYDGTPTACIQGLDKYQRTIYLGTFSKTLYPGLRIGYMVLPHQLVKAFTYARSIIDGHTPQILQLTLAQFMDDGHYNAHVRAMRKLYAERRQVMLDVINNNFDGIVTALHPKGGMQIPCLLDSEWSEEETVRLAAVAGIHLPRLSQLYFGKNKKQGWLLGYASLSSHEIDLAAARLLQGLKKRQR